MKHNKWMVLSNIMIIFIFGNSLMPGSVSGEHSDAVTKLLEYIIFFVFQVQMDLSNLTFMLRKAAHFLEFALLGFFVIRALLERELPLNKAVILALMISVFVGVVDESIQYFVPGRAMSVFDMLIDASGATLGIFMVYSTRKEKEGEL